jgi:hypothetical protein
MRLQALVTPPADISRYRGTGPVTQLVGRVGNGTFKVQLPIRGRNSFAAILRGTYRSEGRVTYVRATSNRLWFAAVFLLIWESFVLVGLLGAIRASNSQNTMILGFMAFVGLTLGVVGPLIHRGERERIAKLLAASIAPGIDERSA